MALLPIRRALLSVTTRPAWSSSPAALPARRRAGLHRRHRTPCATPAWPSPRSARSPAFRRCWTAGSRPCTPAIHGGILARRDDAGRTWRRCEQHGIAPIDLVVVNLYPFEDTVARAPARRVHREDRHRRPGHDPRRREEPRRRRGRHRSRRLRDVLGGGSRQRRHRRRAAPPAGAARPSPAPPPTTPRSPPGSPARPATAFPERVVARPARCRASALRREPAPAGRLLRHRRASRAGRRDAQLQGKELSYNNLADTDAALRTGRRVRRARRRDHQARQPLRRRHRRSLARRLRRALACDPISAFGGIVACNRPLDAAAAGDHRDLHRGRDRPRRRRRGRGVFAKSEPAPAPDLAGMPDPTALATASAGSPAASSSRSATRLSPTRDHAAGRHPGADRGGARRPAVRLARSPSTSSRTPSCSPATAPRSASAPAR